MIMVLHDYCFKCSLLSQTVIVCICRVRTNILRFLGLGGEIVTRNQIDYANLQQTKVRDAEAARHNTAVEMETHRHNVVTEGQTDTNLKIMSYNAQSQRMSAHAQQGQAAAALQNAATNVRMADIAQQNADTNRFDAETRRIVGSSQAALNEAQTLLKHQESAVFNETHAVQMWESEAKADYYSSRAGAEEMNALSNKERAGNDSARVAIERVLAKSNVDLNKEKITNLQADSAYKLIQAEYTENENVRKWIDTAFGSLKNFSSMWSASQEKGTLWNFVLSFFG